MTSFEAFSQFLVSECSDMKLILDRLNVSDPSNQETVFSDLIHEYIAVKGHVQSGKTQFMLCLCMLVNWFKWSIVVIVRNLQSDMDQFCTRLDECKLKYKPYLSSIRVIKSTTTSLVPRTKECIYVCLGNNSSMNKILQLVGEQPYIICIDEVDALDIRNESKRNQALLVLKEKARCVFGISATVMDPLSTERITNRNIMILHSPDNYKGIHDIHFHELEGKSVFSGKITDHLLELHEPLLPFLHDFSKRSSIENNGTVYPNIALVNIGSTVAPYEELQHYMLSHFPMITTIVYNGKGVSVGYENQIEHRRESISETLQWCKEEGSIRRFPYIMIFSGLLAGRGISFTDMDYQWHIHILYLIVPKQSNEMELIQKIRLCGRYNDTIPLELYTTQAIYTDLVKAYYRQEEIVISLLKHKENTICQDQLSEMTLLREKFTKRPMLKKGKSLVQPSDIASETEWNEDVYDRKQLPPKEAFETYGTAPPEFSYLSEQIGKTTTLDDVLEEKEVQRLSEKMFRLWSKNIGQTRISVFLDQLDPSKLYSKSEMMELCTFHNIPLQHVMKNTFKNSESKGYGKIIQRKQGMYRLYPELLNAHIHYFTHV
jgi:hypothetical protein